MIEEKKNKESKSNLKVILKTMRNKIQRKKGTIFYYQYQIAFVLIPLGFLFLIFYPNFINKVATYPNTPIDKNIQIPSSSDKLALVSKEYDQKNHRLSIIFVRNNGTGTLEDNKDLKFATDEITTNKYQVKGFKLNTYSYELIFSNLPKTFKTIYIRLSTSDDDSLVNKNDPFNGGETTSNKTNSETSSASPLRIFVNNDSKISHVHFNEKALEKTSIEAETYRQKLIKTQIKIARNNIKDYQKYIKRQKIKISGYKQDLEFSTGEQSTEIKQSIENSQSNISSTNNSISTLYGQITEAKKQIELSQKQQNAMLTNDYKFQKFTVHKIR